MKIVAISGSYRKGKTVETLMERAFDGIRALRSDADIEMIRLADKKIDYCRNCYSCYNDDPSKPFAKCVINDDMQSIYPLLDEAEGYVFGTPVNIAHETAVMKTFLERICYVFAKPGNYPLKGCPEPRSKKKKKAIIIVSSGVVPPILRKLCDEATSLLKEVCKFAFNADTTGTMYAGAVQNTGVDAYFKKAYRLGESLVL